MKKPHGKKQSQINCGTQDQAQDQDCQRRKNACGSQTALQKQGTAAARKKGKGGLQDPGKCLKTEIHISPDEIHVQAGNDQLADKDSPQISCDPQTGNRQQDKKNPDQETCQVLEKSQKGVSQPVKDTGEGSRKVEEGADKGKDLQKNSRLLIVKDQDAQGFPVKEKNACKKDTQKQAVFDGFFCGRADRVPVSPGLIAGNCGEQKCGNGAGNGGGKHEKRHGHSGKNAINGQSSGIGHAGQLKLAGDQYGFRALQQSQQHPVGGKRKSQGQEAAAAHSQGSQRGAPVYRVLKMNQQADPCEKGGGQFPGDHAAYSQKRCGRTALIQKNRPDQKGGADTHQLFQKLGGGGNCRFLPGVVIRAYTGVNSAKRDSPGNQLQKRLAAGFSQQPEGKKGRMPVEKQGGSQRQREGDPKTCQKTGAGPGGVFFRQSGCAAAGDTGLHAGYHQREAKRIDRKDQLIDPHSFRTNGMGKEYPIEKAYDPAGEAGEHQNKRAGNERMFF